MISPCQELKSQDFGGAISNLCKVDESYWGQETAHSESKAAFNMLAEPHYFTHICLTSKGKKKKEKQSEAELSPHAQLRGQGNTWGNRRDSTPLL